jgi:hypothetical protein
MILQRRQCEMIRIRDFGVLPNPFDPFCDNLPSILVKPLRECPTLTVLR